MDNHVNGADGALAVNLRQAAALLGVSDRTVWSLVQRREIPHLRLGKRLLFRPESLRAWLCELERGAAPEQRGTPTSTNDCHVNVISQIENGEQQ